MQDELETVETLPEQIPSPETTELSEAEEQLKEIRKLSEQSIDEISTSVFQERNDPLPDPEQILNEPANKPLETIEDVNSELDSLSSDIEEAKLDDAKTPQSIGSFDGLKTRYKKTIDGLKAKVEEYESLSRNLAAEKEEISNLKKHNQEVEELQAKYESLQREHEEHKKELDEARYYRRKVDASNDPILKNKYLEPMENFKEKSMAILNHVGVDNVNIDQLANASEVEINSFIEESGITGLNATSLKNHLDQYFMHKSQYDKETSPEYIDSMLKQYKGKRIQLSDSMAKDIFDAVKADFDASEHIDSIRKSNVNKDHNLYVHDQVVDSAQNTYQNFRRLLGDEFLNPPVLSLMAKAAYATSAYPYTAAVNEHLLKANAALIEELKAQDSGASVTQTSEMPTSNSPSDLLTELKNISNSSISDIAESVTRK